MLMHDDCPSRVDPVVFTARALRDQIVSETKSVRGLLDQVAERLRRKRPGRNTYRYTHESTRIGREDEQEQPQERQLRRSSRLKGQAAAGGRGGEVDTRAVGGKRCQRGTAAARIAGQQPQEQERQLRRSPRLASVKRQGGAGDPLAERVKRSKRREGQR